LLPSEEVDEERSFVGFHYYAGELSQHSDISVKSVRQDIAKGKYIHIGPINENRNLIDSE